MYYFRTITFFWVLFFYFTLHAFSQTVYNDTIYAAPANETCNSYIPTYDNGFAMTGSTASYGAGGTDIYLSKLDANHNVLWTKTYGGLLNDISTYIRQTLDSGYLLVGTTESFGAGNTDAIAIRTDQQGTVLWSKTYGGPGGDQFLKGEALNDGNFIMVGNTNSYGAGDQDIMIMKLGPSGDTLWTSIIGGSVYDAALGVTPVNDGGFAFAGRTYSYGEGLRDALLFKTDVDGNLLWFRTYGGQLTDEATFVRQTFDNGFIATGATETFTINGIYDVYLLKTDSTGMLQWSKTYGGDKVDASYDVRQTTDSGYVLTGFTDSYASSFRISGNQPPGILGDDSSHVLLLKTDANGDTLWSRAFGSNRTDEAYSVFQSADGGYYVGAYSNSFSGTDSTDIYIIHTDSLGVIACGTKYIHPLVGTPATVVNTYNPSVISGVIVNSVPVITGNATWQGMDPCIPLSINENFVLPGITFIAPNPFNKSAIIHFPEKLTQSSDLFIYDVYGKEVKNISVSSGVKEVKIDKGSLADGIYFVQLYTAQKIIFAGKIIIASN
jgi:hypothetical protein